MSLSDDDRFGPLEKRVAALEAWKTGVDTALRNVGQSQTSDATGIAGLATIRERIQAVEKKVDALLAAGTNGSSTPDATALGVLQGEVATLSTALKELREQLVTAGAADAATVARLESVEAWRTETDTLLAALRAADVPNALAAMKIWKDGVDAVLVDLAAWRASHDARATALEDLASRTSACIARLDLARADLPPPADAERLCDEVRLKILALGALEGNTRDMATALAALGDRVANLERITSARLARLRELELAVFLERYRSERSLAPCGDNEPFTLTLGRSRVRTTFTVTDASNRAVTGTLRSGRYSHVNAAGEACSFAVATKSRSLKSWEREALGLPDSTRSISVREVCWTAAAPTPGQTCETVFERTVTP